MYQRKRLKAALATVFFTSGAVSVIFQVTWQRLLTLYYGVGPVSITLIVSVYMFGLGVGSLLGGRLAEKVRRPIGLYLVTELSLGLFGLLSLPFLDYLGRHTAGMSHWLSLFCMILFLCMPTLCMGMTLPLIVKIFSGAQRNFLDTVAFLYFLNTLGAAAGALLGSYVLISFLGVDRTIYIAAGTAFALAGAICLIQGRSGAAQLYESAELEDLAAPGLRPVRLGYYAYLVVFITGFVAIGYEISWFRFLEVLLKASPYVFPTMLAVYLIGIALGSRLMSKCLQRFPNADIRSLFFLFQFLIGAFVVLAFTGYYYLTRHTAFGALTDLSFGAALHPSWAFPNVSWRAALFLAGDIFFWPALFVLVPTLLMGASFPLIAHLAHCGQGREGQTIGQVYFCNTLGNLLGGVLTGFLFLPTLGTEITLLTLSIVSMCLVAFTRSLSAIPLGCRLGVCLLFVSTAALIFPGRGQLYATIHPHASGGERYFAEGLEGVVMTYEEGEHVKNYINGLKHGGRPGYMFYRETVETLAHAPRAERILVIGFGTGSITEAVLKLPEVQKVTLVEINRTLMENLSKLEVFRNILADPRLELVIDDGRRFLLQTAGSYDLVLIDPLVTTTAYSNNLYSQEFFALVHKKLSTDGVFLVWSDEGRVVPRTLASAFPHVRWYNYFCLASGTEMISSARKRESILQCFSPTLRSGIESFPAVFLGNEAHIMATTHGYPVNHDWRPNCEYFLGLRTWVGLLGLK